MSANATDSFVGPWCVCFLFEAAPFFRHQEKNRERNSLLFVLRIDEIRTFSIVSIFAGNGSGNGHSPTTPNPISIAQSLTPFFFSPFSHPQWNLSAGFLKCSRSLVPFTGANTTNIYRCFPVLGGGPGAFQGMTSTRSREAEEVLAWVAIQWQT